ncbi:UNVERIFIED_CONTAM: Tetraketide alpha-pyrone reductase 1 [Sesamum angustifolium]|uniref:Tetraketide alpha-pyrone reductase 1 n=1 Tax=Sesamum angustifolium TaxID=2727405 RepID=A0AAW2JFP9_9LAMI
MAGEAIAAAWLYCQSNCSQPLLYETDDPKKILHLKSLEGAEERLQLLQADLIENGSFDSVVDGCEAVFHTASPVLFSTTHPQVPFLV